jgi:hypothetical protein
MIKHSNNIRRRGIIRHRACAVRGLPEVGELLEACTDHRDAAIDVEGAVNEQATLPAIISCGLPWSQSLVKIDLAFSFLWPGNQDLEHASTLAREALEAPAGRPVVSVQQRMSGFIRAATATWGNVPQIAAIREIAGILGTRQPVAGTKRLP